MKKKIGIRLLSVCLIALSAGSTAAVITSADTARNVITTGEVRVSLVERQRPEDGQLQSYPAQPIPVMPGQTVSKIAAVSNDAAQPAWVRARVEIDASGEPELDPEQAMSLIGLGDGWTYNPADGWYYCDRVLAPGTETVPLFHGVDFSAAEMDNTYSGLTLEVRVTAQGVQSANNGQTVWQAAGWPAEKAGGEGA